MQVSLANVNVVTKTLSNGTVKQYRYHKLTKQRIEGEPGTPAYLRSYLEASEKKVEAKGNSFSGLLIAYKNSPEFRALAPSTQANYRQRIEVLRHGFGDIDLAAFAERKIRAQVLAWRDEIALDTPQAADALMKLFKAILSFAEQRAIIDINPLRGIKRIPSKDRAGQVWTLETVQRLLKVAQPTLKQAVKLALFTGQRKGDLIKLKWAHRDGNFLRLRQAKTFACVGLPIGPLLEGFLGQLNKSAPTLLTNTFGQSWGSTAGIEWHWQNALEQAGLKDANLHFHDLRGSVIQTLADMGCTPAQIAAISGHSVESASGNARMLKSYMKLTDAQAVEAMAKLEQSWIGQL